MIDRAVIGQALPPFEATMERGRLRFFATATGQQDPVYSDLEAARAAGHRDLPVPPTFVFGLPLERPGAFDWLAEIGVDLRFVLHGEQRFDYHELAYAGDTLRYASRITDVYDKRGGALEFIDVAVAIERDGGGRIADVRQITVVRHPEAA